MEPPRPHFITWQWVFSTQQRQVQLCREVEILPESEPFLRNFFEFIFSFSARCCLQGILVEEGSVAFCLKPCSLDSFFPEVKYLSSGKVEAKVIWFPEIRYFNVDLYSQSLRGKQLKLVRMVLKCRFCLSPDTNRISFRPWFRKALRCV